MADEVVLDSGAVTTLAQGSSQARALIAVMLIEDEWPPVVPSVVLAECLTGKAGNDARVNKLLKACRIETQPTERIARRAAALRTAARRGSAVDAVVVASAEPGGTVMTGDLADITALADNAADVAVRRV